MPDDIQRSRPGVGDMGVGEGERHGGGRSQAQELLSS